MLANIYLIDKRGKLRHRKTGEGEYDATERVIRSLFDEMSPQLRLNYSFVNRLR